MAKHTIKICYMTKASVKTCIGLKLLIVKHRWHACEGGAAPTPSTIALSAGSPGPIMALINAEHFP